MKINFCKKIFLLTKSRKKRFSQQFHGQVALVNFNNRPLGDPEETNINVEEGRNSPIQLYLPFFFFRQKRKRKLLCWQYRQIRKYEKEREKKMIAHVLEPNLRTRLISSFSYAKYCIEKKYFLSFLFRYP